MTIKEYLTTYNVFSTSVIDSYTFLGSGGAAIIENLMRIKYGMRELYLYDAPEDPGTMEPDIQFIVDAVMADNAYRFNKLYASMAIEYTPGNYTDMTETENITNSGADEISGESSGNGTNILTPARVITKARTPFDSGVFADTEKQTESGTEASINEVSTTNAQTNTFGKIMDREVTRRGRENIDPDRVISSERKIAEFRFYGLVAETVVNHISLLTYNFN